MKKSAIMLAACLLIGSTAFVKYEVDNWSGSASVTVSPEEPDYWKNVPCSEQYKRDGSPKRSRVINVTGNTTLGEGEMKSQLLASIKSEMKCYETMSSSVKYSISRED